MSDTDTTPNLRKRVLGRVFAALNRADEVGGEVRDYLQEKVLRDDRYVALRRRVAALRGQRYESRADGEARARVAAAAAAAAAPPPEPAIDAATAKQDKPLGDASIKAQIYGKHSCPWTGRSITLLEKHKVDYDFIDMDEPEHDATAIRLINETKQHTVPYVFLRGHFVGGYNALAEVERLGQLEVALMTAEERKAAPAHLRNIVITPRPNTDEVAPAETIAPE